MKILDFLFPKQCIWCDKYGGYLCEYCTKHSIQFDLSNICHVCRREIVAPEKYVHNVCSEVTNIDRIRFVVRFNKLAQKIVSSIKYDGFFDYVSVMATLTIKSLNIKDCEDAIFVPVPLHISKYKLRGFNQAELFAIHISKILSKFGAVVAVQNLLVRNMSTKTQVGMDKNQRMENLKNVFEIADEKIITYNTSKIILVDDVYTTGTTMEECARVLRSAGIRNVEGLVFARD
jgi:ComF family protein